MGSSARAAVALAAVAVLVACEPQTDGWVPVLESAPPAYLEQELERAEADVAAARELVRTDPDEALAKLESTAERLESLSGVFMPLLRAKIAATNAYRHHSMGRDSEALEELDHVDELIGVVASETGGALEAELERVSALAARSRVAIQGRSPEAGPHLKTLSETLTDLLTRAGLIL